MGVLTAADGRIRLGWRLLVFVGATLLGASVLGMLLPTGILSGATAILVSSVLSGWWLLAMDARPVSALGFHAEASAPGEALRGLTLGVAVGLVVVGVMALLGGVRWNGQEGSVAAWFAGAAASLGFLVIPAAAEEALLRGYPLQALGETWGAGIAVVITSAVFGLLHLGNPGAGALSIVNVGVAGLFLGVVYVRTLSLWWATGAHLGWNWAHGYLADVPVSGLELMDAPFYDGIASGPAWIGGGGFGPEGSLVATVVLLVVTAGLWWGPWLEPAAKALDAQPLLAGPTTRLHAKTGG